MYLSSVSVIGLDYIMDGEEVLAFNEASPAWSVIYRFYQYKEPDLAQPGLSAR